MNTDLQARRQFLAKILKMSGTLAVLRISGLVPELRSAFAQEATETFTISRLSQAETARLRAVAERDEQYRVLRRYLVSRGYRPQGQEVSGVRASSATAQLDGLFTSYRGASGTAHLDFLSGAGGAHGAIAVIAGDAVYGVRGGQVVVYPDGTRRLAQVQRLPHDADGVSAQTHCGDCCWLIAFCVLAGGACWLGCLPCCPAGLGICATGAATCSVCPCGT